MHVTSAREKTKIGPRPSRLETRQWFPLVTIATLSYHCYGPQAQNSDFSPSASDSQGCFKFPQPYEGIFHSGLTISHSVNLDYCLAHCSILSFKKALVINGVHCVCTNRTNFVSRQHTWKCNSPKPFNNEPAGFLFDRIYPVTASVLSFPSKVILHNYFSFRDINSKRKLTVFYDLSDGNVGKTCTSTLQR